MGRLSYVPGSSDRRSYGVRGVTLHVLRSPSSRSVSFDGGGRDGDFVPEGAPEPQVLRAMIGDVPVRAGGACDCEVATEDDLVVIEARLDAESGGPFAVTRSGDGTLSIARALLEVPVGPGAERRWSLRAAFSLSVDEPLEGDAIATPWAWGKDPGDWLARTLVELGLPVVVHSGSGNGAALAIPRACVHALLSRALDTPLLGFGALELTDSRRG